MSDTARARAQLGQTASILQGERAAHSTATQVTVPLLASLKYWNKRSGEAERAWALIQVRTELGARF